MVAQSIELGKKPHVIVATPVSFSCSCSFGLSFTHQHDRAVFWTIWRRRRGSALPKLSILS